MVGAGAGIGGHGGSGGNSNDGWWSIPWTLGQSGTDGKAGENCGIVTINNSLTVNAYGGSGASGGLASLQDSGTGGGGYPGAGIGGRWSWSVAGGNHMDGAGGYSAGTNEGCTNNRSYNGCWDVSGKLGVCGTSGGCYYTNNYETIDGNGSALVRDVAFEHALGGRRWRTEEILLKIVGWILAVTEVLLEKEEKYLYHRLLQFVLIMVT